MSYFVFGAPKVEERDNQIVISNIHAKVMANDIKRLFKTSRVSKYIFSEISRGGFTIESFFALELYHITEALMRFRRLGTNIHALGQLRDRLLENTWLRNIGRPGRGRLNMARLRDMTYTPIDYQQEFLDTYNHVPDQYGLKGMLLSATAGSGKTFTSLALGQCLEADNIIVISPLTAVERVWVKNINAVYKRTPSHWHFSSGEPYEGERILIFHYEALDKALDMARRFTRKKTLVILDESHNMAEMGSGRTQRFIQLCQDLQTDDVVLASGTPIKASTLETVPVLKAIDPQFTDEVMDRYKRIFAGDANKATTILAERLGAVSFKVEKEQLGLEPPIFRNLPVKIPNAEQYTLANIQLKMRDFILDRIGYYERNVGTYQATYDQGIAASQCWAIKGSPWTGLDPNLAYARYRELVIEIQQAHERNALQSVSDQIKETNFYERNVIMPNIRDPELRKAFKEAKTVVKYLKLKVQGECLGRVLGGERIRAHVDMVKHIDFEALMATTTKKTVVFTSYIKALEAADEHLKSLKLKPLTVYGKNTRELADTVQRFEDKTELNPLIATYDSLATAVPLTMADTMLLINMPFRDYILQQAVSRIHRLGADTQTYVYTAILDTGEEPNISSRNLDILQWSQGQIEAIMQMESPFKVDYEGDEIGSEPALEDISGYIPPSPVGHEKSWIDW